MRSLMPLSPSRCAADRPLRSARTLPRGARDTCPASNGVVWGVSEAALTEWGISRVIERTFLRTADVRCNGRWNLTLECHHMSGREPYP